MTNRHRIQCLLAFLLFIFSSIQIINAQSFTGEKLDFQSVKLKEAFADYEVFRFNAEQLGTFVKSNAESNLSFQVGNHNWDLNLTSSNLFSPDYFLTVQTPNGNEVIKQYPNIAFKGYEKNGGRVRLTINKDFLYGFIEENGLVWRIEPLRYLLPGADQNLFLIYEKSSVSHDHKVECGVTHEMEKAAEWDIKELLNNASPDLVGTFELELAIASDKLMLDKYGSVAAVENHNVGVINDVEVDYTGNFDNDLCFNIVTQFVATSWPGPWSASNDAGTLLGSFRTWGNGGNFGANFDIGELWTDRDFTGGTVGIAYLNGVCNSSNYHCLQDFTGNSEQLRCMTSHEIGHNFSAVHDGGGGFIMSPFVSNSNVWSGQSVNSISSYMQSKINNGCLADCNPAPPLIADFDWAPNPACAGTPVDFTDLSSGLITTWNWAFSGGNPPSSTSQNPTSTFTTPGSHNVTLTIVGAGGSNSITKSITIDPQPFANYSFTMNNLTATFTNLSTDADSYLWDFGDGGQSSEVNPEYTYFQAGLYVVTLTAFNSCGEATKTFTVNTWPTPDFSADPTSGCASLLVQFQNESSNNSVSYAWSFPGGSPAASNQPNPIVIYQSSGTFPVTLTAFNSVGSNTITKTDYITVQTVPAPGFTHTANGLTVTFDNTSVNATSYLWEFGDGDTSTVEDPVHIYPDGGTYSVTLTAINDCGEVIKTKDVTVAPPPVAAFSTSGNSGCAPFTVEFTDNSSGADSLHWDFPGGNPASSSDPNPVVVYNTAGTYVATLTAFNASGNTSVSDTITVTTVPDADFSSVTNGVIVTFTNNSTEANSYEWDFGDGENSTEQDPVHEYATDGVYTVVLSATNDCGTVTSTQTVTIVTPPTANFNSNETEGCAPFTVQFNNASSNNSVSFEWIFPGGNPGTSTETNPTVVYDTPGTYDVTLIATNSAGSDTTTLDGYINVNTTPDAGFTSANNGHEVTFTNTSSNADSYEWDFGDGNNSAEQDPVHEYDMDGTYTVVLTATNECGTTTATMEITVTTLPTANFNAPQTSGCVPFTVQFNNASSNNSVSFEWIFPGGNPSTSTDQNPVVVYDTPGTYDVTLIATNAAGSDTTTLVDYISVGTVPTAGFNESVVDSLVSLTNTSVDADSYEWDFGDGDTSTESDPDHIYTSDGTYTIVLTATNDCGTSTYTQTVDIVTSPQAGFGADDTEGCAPFTVQFIDMSSDNTDTWSWDFPGGDPSTSSDPNPVVVYNTPGVYDVTLIASGPGGSSMLFMPAFITVLGPPSSGFTSVVNTNSVSFTNTSSNATSYMWEFGDGGTSTEVNPSHTYTEDGTYTVTLSATNDCGTTIYEETITIVTVPVAAFTFNSNVGCAPLVVDFANTSSDNATDYFWEFEGGTPATSTEKDPVVTWNTPGTYTVTLTASNSAGGSTATASITVNGTPNAGFSTTTGGLTVITNNSSQGANSYDWNFGDGSFSNLANPTHTYAGVGTYTVVLIASNECGSDTTSQEVIIEGSAPVPAFTADMLTGCPGIEINFTDETVGDPTSWNWTFGGGNPSSSTDQNPSVTYTTPGVYDVTLEATNLFGSNTVTQQAFITIIDLPTAGFDFTVVGGAVTFNNSSMGGNTYLWDFGDGNTSDEANPTHMYVDNGMYTVTLTVTNTCGASTLEQVVVITSVGTSEAAWINQFKLFPNPTSGFFTVEMTGLPENNVEFALFNNLGQLMSSQIIDFSSGNLNKQFDFSELPSSVYTLRIQANGSAKYVKVVVQK